MRSEPRPEPTCAAILACEMIEDETLLALERVFPEDARPPLVWIEAALHDRPEKLQKALQGLVSELDEGARAGQPVNVRSVLPGEGPVAERLVQVEVAPQGDIVLGFGYCGGGLKELMSTERRLVFPRVDANTLHDSFTDWVKRYGPERAKRVRDMMYAHYERLTLIDTGAYDVGEWLPMSESRAEELGLAHAVVPGSVQTLVRLFGGDWDTPDIVVVEPGEAVGIDHVFDVEGSRPVCQ